MVATRAIETTPAAAAARYVVHGIPIRVMTDVPEAAAAVATTYAAFAVAGEPADMPDVEVVVEVGGSGGRSPSSTTSAVLALLDRVVDVVITGLAARGVLATHAGAVEIDGRAYLLSGHSGAGKSTLTLGLVRAGAGWLTDELALIAPDDSTVLPYPRAIHVSPETVGLLPGLGFLGSRPRQALGGDSEWSVSADDVVRAFGGRLAPATPLGGVIVLDGRPIAERPPRLQSMSAAVATMELLRQTPAAARDLVGTMGRLAGIVERVQTMRLEVGALDATVDAVRTWAAGRP